MNGKIVGKKNNKFMKDGKEISFCQLSVLSVDKYTDGFKAEIINTSIERSEMLQLNKEYSFLYDKGYDNKAILSAIVPAESITVK